MCNAGERFIHTPQKHDAFWAFNYAFELFLFPWEMMIQEKNCFDF